VGETRTRRPTGKSVGQLCVGILGEKPSSLLGSQRMGRNGKVEANRQNGDVKEELNRGFYKLQMSVNHEELGHWGNARGRGGGKEETPRGKPTMKQFNEEGKEFSRGRSRGGS